MSCFGTEKIKNIRKLKYPIPSQYASKNYLYGMFIGNLNLNKMETIQSNEIVFLITKEDLQYEAKEKIGRELTDEEIQIAKQGLEFGLLTDINTIYSTIFSEMM